MEQVSRIAEYDMAIRIEEAVHIDSQDWGNEEIDLITDGEFYYCLSVDAQDEARNDKGLSLMIVRFNPLNETYTDLAGASIKGDSQIQIKSAIKCIRENMTGEMKDMATVVLVDELD